MEIPASVKSVAKQIVDVQQAIAGKNPGFRTHTPRASSAREVSSPAPRREKSVKPRTSRGSQFPSRSVSPTAAATRTNTTASPTSAAWP